MSMIVWILLGVGVALIASKIVSTTGEGTVVDILLGIVGAVVGGWLFNLFGGNAMTGFDIDSIYSAVPPLSAISFCAPCQGALFSPGKVRAGKLSLQPEALGADQEATNGLKHSEKRPLVEVSGPCGPQRE